MFSDEVSLPDKHKFDSRTYVKPKKRVQRPSIHNIVEVASNPPSISPQNSLNATTNKYLTYNKYSMPLGPVSPMLRLKTFNVDVNTENSNVIKEYAMKRRSLVQDDDPQVTYLYYQLFHLYSSNSELSSFIQEVIWQIYQSCTVSMDIGIRTLLLSKGLDVEVSEVFISQCISQFARWSTWDYSVSGYRQSLLQIYKLSEKSCVEG